MAILVVDDDDDIREAVREVLAAEGYETVAAANGAEAKQHLKTCAERPELILLDLMMPVMDGWQFLLWLDDAPEWRDTPVAIMSAHPAIQRAFDISRNKPGAPHVLLHGGNRQLLPKPLSILRLLAIAGETSAGMRGSLSPL